MPGKNVIKQYEEGGYYHVYNRGVEKRDIFLDDRDYRVFLSYLKQYLSPTSNETDSSRTNLSEEVELLAYCLMPNHFHLFVKQIETGGITRLMQGISTRYVMYFNRRYSRVGRLFQGPFKAAAIANDQHLMHLSRYIHLNPQPIRRGFKQYPYSSYRHYLAQSRPSWLKPDFVLEMFGGKRDYADFTKGYIRESKSLLKNLTLE